VEFGIRLHLNTDDYQEIRQFAEEADKLGYHSVWVNDHLIPPSGPMSVPFLESWMTLSAVATVTHRVKVGTLVIPVNFRMPSLIAKMGATLDNLSHGRLILGMGAGWKQEEFDAFGLPFPDAKTRVEQLDEAVQIVKRMWTERKASFTGKHYRIDEAFVEPKPVQKPHPPLLIGGTKSGILRVAAKHADIWNISYPPSKENFEQVLRNLDRVLDRVRQNRASLRRSVLLESLVGEDKKAFEDMLVKSSRSRGMTEEEYARRLAFGMAGSPDECFERVRYFQDRGVDLIVLSFPSNKSLDQLGIFAERVVKEVH
jgi:probable F420-dependent oxidoreductase